MGQGAGAGSSQGIVKVENGAEITADSINLNRGATLMGNGGIINADVNLNAGGLLRPVPSPGIMTINGDLTQITASSRSRSAAILLAYSISSSSTAP